MSFPVLFPLGRCLCYYFSDIVRDRADRHVLDLFTGGWDPGGWDTSAGDIREPDHSCK